jgi:hypothetical protein
MAETLEERARAWLRERYPHLYDLEGDLADLAADAQHLTALLAAVVEKEREACAKELEDMAQRIRARGEVKP